MWIDMIFILKITKRWYDVDEEMIWRLCRYMWGFGSVLMRMVKVINAITDKAEPDLINTREECRFTICDIVEYTL